MVRSGGRVAVRRREPAQWPGPTRPAAEKQQAAARERGVSSTVAAGFLRRRLPLQQVPPPPSSPAASPAGVNVFSSARGARLQSRAPGSSRRRSWAPRPPAVRWARGSPRQSAETLRPIGPRLDGPAASTRAAALASSTGLPSGRMRSGTRSAAADAGRPRRRIRKAGLAAGGPLLLATPTGRQAYVCHVRGNSAEGLVERILRTKFSTFRFRIIRTGAPENASTT